MWREAWDLLETTPERHYVLIVHGTFAGPTEEQLAAVGTDAAPWYLPGGDFAERLNGALAGTPLGAAVWRDIEVFHWTGENLHTDRLEAGAALAARLLELRRTEPHCRIHLVAHSHGGNVLLAGVQKYFERLGTESERLSATLAATLDHGGDPQPALERAFDAVFGDAARLRLSRLDAVAPGFREFLAREWSPSARRGGVDRILSAMRRVESGLRQVLGVLVIILRFLLRLPVGRVRSGKEVLIEQRLAQAWVSARANHRLGRIVFLGTPFLHRRPHRLSAITRLVFDVTNRLIVFAVFAAAGWALVYITTGALSALPRVAASGWDPRLWHPLELLAWAVLAGPGLFVARAPPKPASNLYFDSMRNPLVHACHGRPERRLGVLVITAQQLDEALLGLSARPAVFAYMTPHIRTLLTPGFGLESLPPPHSNETLGAALLRMVEWTGGLLLRNVASLLAWTVLAFLRPRLIRGFTDKLVNIVSAASLGVPAGEMRRADIEVSGDPRVAGAMRVETWSTARLLAQLQLLNHDAAGENEARYRFVWNDHALDTMSSDTWNRVKEHEAHILRRFRYDHDVTLFTADLKRTCATLDERVKEVTGSVSLTHKAYYGDERVIARIARFLVYGGGRA